MKILPTSDYSIVKEVLNSVSINHFFARTIVERQLDGTIYADSLGSPTVFYIIHPYGMSLLTGDYSQSAFLEEFYAYSLNLKQERRQPEWLQAFPGEWNHRLQELWKGKIVNPGNTEEEYRENRIEQHTRVNFRFNRAKYLHFLTELKEEEVCVVPVDGKLFSEMKGSVVPAFFWRDADHFLESGKGYSVLVKGELASTAYSAFVQGSFLELGIETVEKFRGMGLASYACAALIDYCLVQNYEPVWSCRLENTASYRLAQRIGFEPILEWPYYKLPV